MAFYHFIAIFPSLLIFLTLAGHIPGLGTHSKEVLFGVAKDILPWQASALVRDMLNELDRHLSLGLHFLAAVIGASWAALNGTWALIYGLNTAYDVQEHRPKWKRAVTVVGLAFALASLCSAAVALVFAAGRLESLILGQQTSFDAPNLATRGFEWITLAGVLMIGFSIVYRYAPNLQDARWCWSTPGAVCALLLWLCASLGTRTYFEHFNDYSRPYGHLNSVVMILFWLYLSNGAVLIGGEMNSVIQKAAKTESSADDRSGS